MTTSEPSRVGLVSALLALMMVALGPARTDGHPEYLDNMPNGHNKYFATLPGVGAIGHMGDESGARLNQFGRAYCGGDALGDCDEVRAEVRRRHMCYLEDVKRAEANEDDDDDDDDHHHGGKGQWTIKFCCNDADWDGQPNGLELGDPCCKWKKHGEPANTTSISHPGMASEKTSRPFCTTKMPFGCGARPGPSPPPSPPGPPPPGPPGPPSQCERAMEIECGDAKRNGSSSCLLCCGQHALILKLQGCSEKDFTTYCGSSLSDPSVPTPSLGRLFVQGRNARQMLTDAGWTLVDHPEDADLIWVINRCHLGAYSPNPATQSFNLLPWDHPMTDKALLAQHLKAHDAKVLPGDPLGHSSSFVPPTFHLSDQEQRREFVEAIAACEVRSGAGECGEPWILKRTDLSNGEGATIIPSPSLTWAAGPNVTQLGQNPRERWIAQRYINSPLLLNGRKSEIRVYWMVASLQPLVVFYNPGTVRLNAAAYTAGDYSNDLVHITNTRRQLRNATLGAAAVQNHGKALKLKWSHATLRDNLAARFGPGSWEQLQTKLKRMIVRAVNATRSELTTRVGNTTGVFQLLGADFIVDSDLTPWMTEIQTGPGLSHDDAIKAQVIPTVLHEAAQIGLAAHRLKTGRKIAWASGLAELGKTATVWQPLINEA